MHGLFGSKQNNRSISKALARDLGIEIYAVDLRNHGDSPHAPEHTYMAMADDVEEFIQSHGLGKPVLIGHSMGAKVAMTLALRSPAKISALIPVDNAPTDVMLKSDFAKYTYGMRKIVEKGVTDAKKADEILKEYEDSLPIRQFLLTNLTRPRPPPTNPNPPATFRIPLPTLTSSLPHMGDFPFRDPDTAHYDGPTLVIRGMKSTYVPDEALPVIGAFFPRFEVVDLEAGHWVISERPEEFRAAVVEFLERVWEKEEER
ncbi:hypothetical protein MMC30_005513 [Trapelia coarctata]|nr:hypothetical protein [Trapelia coarctata]